MSIYRMIAKTVSGLENVLLNEIIQLGGQNPEVLTRAVAFYGDKKLMYQANYLLRTALRILKPIKDFDANNNEEFYKQIYDIEWNNLFNVNATFSIDGVVSDSFSTHSKFVALKTKDAIVDRFRDITGKRPSVELDNPDFKINVHIHKNHCTISLDSSGESLHKRGYREISGEAPMSEVLAAGLILLSGWKKDCNFYDPMCGSGTLITEAAMIACNMPAGFHRNNYSFQHWADYDKDLYKQIVLDAKANQTKFEFIIFASDRAIAAIHSTKKNVQSLNSPVKISIKQQDFSTVIPNRNEGILITNPPYGERLESDDLIGLYKEIGNNLKRNFAGFNAWIISSDLQALKFIGLKPSKKIPVFNGPLDCRFFNFNVFSGSLKEKKINENL